VKATTSLPWRSLVHDRGRFVSSLLGVGFAVVLMFVELGFLNGAYDSVTRFIRLFDADLVIVSVAKEDMDPPAPFPRPRLMQALAQPEVAGVEPLYSEALVEWYSPRGLTGEDVRVLAFDPEAAVFLSLDVRARQRLLLETDTGLADSRSRDLYGGLEVGDEGELAGRRLRIVGTFEGGIDLANNGTLLISDRQLAARFGGPDRLERVEFGLVRLRPEADRDAVRAELEGLLAGDVEVLTKEALEARIHEYWRRNQPVGSVFGLGLAVGFLIGGIISYQVLFNDINDHLPELATLKAVGYRNGTLLSIALTQGLYLGLLAFGLGLAVSLVTYGALARVSGLLLELTVGRVALVLALTLAMCTAAAAMAVQRAFRADPADLF
jgi:putative ABC transport system permease protein